MKPKKSIRAERAAKCDVVIVKLKALESEHGTELVRAAFNRHVRIERETRWRNDRIQQLQGEINRLEGKE